MINSSAKEVPNETLYMLALKEKCEQSFKLFVKYFFKIQYGTEFIWSYHHQQIADVLMDVYEGRKTYVIINMPPRYGKTALIIQMFNAWTYAKNPRCQSLHLSYSKRLALTNSSIIMDTLRLPEYQALWPESRIVKNSKEEWKTLSGGVFKSDAAGGQVTGFGAGNLSHEMRDGKFYYSGAVFIDDPLKPDDANSDVERENVNERWDSTIKSRLNAPTTPTVVVMQRVHELDFAGKLLSDTEMKWHQLVLPAILNEGTEEESALWPEMHSLERLHKMKAKNKYVFSSQYQQDPSPKGGGLIQEQWWSRYDSFDEVYNRCTYLFMTADTAYTSKTTNDPTVIQFWGAESGTRMYLLDQVRGHWEFPELIENAAKFWNKYSGSNQFSKSPSSMYIESKASGLSLIQTLKKHGINARNWKPKSFKFPDDKVGRVKESSWNIMNGDIWLPSQSDWTQGFIDECSKFTNNDTHRHDDQVDAMTMAVSVWRKNGGGTTYRLEDG